MSWIIVAILIIGLCSVTHALTHSTAAKNAATDAVVDLLDVGSSDAAGDLELLTAADATLATIDLAVPPSFGNAVAGVSTANTIANGTASGTGTVAKFNLRSRDNVDVISGTVTATGGGGDITIDNTSIVTSQTISVASLTYEGESA